MKKIVLLVAVVMLSFCSSKKNNFEEHSFNNQQLGNLTEVQRLIINDFLKNEWSKNRYKSLSELPKFIVEKAINILAPIKNYENCYQEKDFAIRSSTNKDWILNSQEISRIKDSLKNSKNYKWKETDFHIMKLMVLKNDDLTKSIKENLVKIIPDSVIIYLSEPILINSKAAFLTYYARHSSFGSFSIERFSVLLKQNHNGNWEVNSYYYDGSQE